MRDLIEALVQHGSLTASEAAEVLGWTRNGAEERLQALHWAAPRLVAVGRRPSGEPEYALTREGRVRWDTVTVETPYGVIEVPRMCLGCDVDSSFCTCGAKDEDGSMRAMTTKAKDETATTTSIEVKVEGSREPEVFVGADTAVVEDGHLIIYRDDQGRLHRMGGFAPGHWAKWRLTSLSSGEGA